MTKKTDNPPINEDIKKLWLQLSQIYHALNQVSHEIKAMQAKQEQHTNGK